MASSTGEVTLRFLAAPTDAGHAEGVGTGRVGGGKVLEWIDKAAYACAANWSGTYCVTAYVGDVRFTRPIPVGDIVEAQAQLVHTGRSSMHIVVTVSSGDPKQHALAPATRCLVVFVAVDGSGSTVPVARWEPRTDEQRMLQEAATLRVGVRAEIEQAMAEQKYTDAGTAPRPVLRFLAAPTDVNWGGKVHGGTVMRWIDDAAFVCATGWAAGPGRGGLRRRFPLLPAAADRQRRRGRGAAAAHRAQQHAHLGARPLRRPEDPGARPRHPQPADLRRARCRRAADAGPSPGCRSPTRTRRWTGTPGT